MSWRRHPILPGLGDTLLSPARRILGPMPKQTSITYDGEGNVLSRTTVTTKLGCSPGCGWLVTIIAVIVAITFPAAYFPTPLAVLAYIVVAAVLIGGIVAAVQRARGLNGADQR